MKIAVSVPNPVLDAAERLTKVRRIPRSQIFSEALVEHITKHGAAAVTAQLNVIYSREASAADTSLSAAQLATLSHETW
ncbi:MAG TPA: hypothetical protein VF269_03445 [Rhodanobacteraceae bacterium]